MGLFSKKSNGFFFWSNKKEEKTETDKAEEMLQLYVKYIPQLKKIMNESSEIHLTNNVSSDGTLIGKMYDFYKNYNGSTSGAGFTPDQFDGGDSVFDPTPMPESLALHQALKRGVKEDGRKIATPLSVMNELERVPTPFTVDGLDEKIATLKDKSNMLMHQRYAKAQIDGLCKRLENRKKYRDNVSFFSSYPNTTDEKIDDLLKKYKLVIKTSDLFVPTFPKEAIDIMKEYTKITKDISGEEPVYYVIAEEKDFAKKFEKLDPILLVQSPFGFYWQILGAWDKEMLLLSEL